MTTSDDPAPVESGILAKANRLLRSISTRSDGNILPLSNNPGNPAPQSAQGTTGNETDNTDRHAAAGPTNDAGTTTSSENVAAPADEKNESHNDAAGAAAAGARSPQENGPAESAQAEEGPNVGGNGTAKPKPNIAVRFVRTVRAILLHSWLNVLLVFVPTGIAVKTVPGVHVAVVFAVNCVAIVPLAGLLSHATESVASKLGDTVGALLNVTFGNAVELIIFIALAKDQIRIVQASLLGSILANLLLILGMCFFLGGLRYREQIYNSTVTQMSACLLSLSVISLVLPTAFHASFSDNELADSQSLKISRGCSVILLLVYLVYLFFQLKSHAFLYESTPQHIVDAESTPGPAAGWMDASSSDGSSSSSSDSDDSSQSRDTVRRRMKRALRNRRGRKPSTSESESAGTANSNFVDTRERIPEGSSSSWRSHRKPSHVGSVHTGGDDGNDPEHGDDEKEERPRRHRHKRHRRHRHSRKHGKHKAHSRHNPGDGEPAGADHTLPKANEQPGDSAPAEHGDPRRIDFAVPGDLDAKANSSPRKPFRPDPLRRVSIKNLAPPVPSGPVPRVRYGIRRTNSLPDRLPTVRAPGAMLPAQLPLMSLTGGTGAEAAQHSEEEDYDRLSTVAAVILLIVSTGLVAVCAEFVVDSINEVVEQGAVKEAFIGLIILPIVGNAAEHVTAITVALKNKMDLAIGVAVGSSIQIALFVTPLVVILGWMMGKEMTLYFTLFETVCLFVSAFIVNFLVLDGRSNYLEGALLMCTYVIIGVVAFYYPNVGEASELGRGG